MTTAEVEAAVGHFAAEARNAIRAGFDGVEVHGANGYLVQQFLAENTNRRTDRFGGSRDGRIRFALDVVRAVADAVGPERVGLRISPTTRRTRSPKRTRRAPTGRSSTPWTRSAWPTCTSSSAARTAPSPTCARAGRAR